MAQPIKSKMKISSRKLVMFSFTLPAVILYLIFSVYPIIVAVFYSFTNWNGMSDKYRFIGLENYIRIFSDKRFFNSILFTLKYAVILVITVIVISMAFSLLLNSRIKGLTFFRAAYFFPAVISMLTAGLIFNQITYSIIPKIGELLNIEVLKTSLLASGDTAIYGILLVSVWQGVAIPTVLLLAGLQTIPSELLEAAEIDGAVKFKQFIYIVIPFIMPVLTVVFVLVFKDGLTVFDYIMALTQGGPGGTTESVSLLIYNHGFREVKFSYSVAEAAILTIIICVVSFLQIGYSKTKKVY